jgi:hypothetical protein
MASERQIEANRRNAAKTAGPRTAAGKRRASRNSFRHGLAARAVLTAHAAEQAEELARAFADGSHSVLVNEKARTAAEATLDLARARQAKVAPMRIIAGLDTHIEPRSLASNIAPHMSEPMTFLDALSKLAAIERYERRALSRRNRAIQWIARAKLERRK